MPSPSEHSAAPTRRRLRSSTLLTAAALTLAACGGDATNALDASTSTASTAPDAPIVQAISGNQVDFSDALTQDTVLWFWAPW